MVQFVLEQKDKRHREFALGTDGVPELEGWTSYIVEGSSLEDVPGMVSVLKFDDQGCGTLAEINFGNYVGITSILGKKFRVLSRKISVETFNQMLAEVSVRIRMNLDTRSHERGHPGA